MNPRTVLVLTTVKGWTTMYGCGWRIGPHAPLDGRRRAVVVADGRNRQRRRNPRWVLAARVWIWTRGSGAEAGGKHGVRRKAGRGRTRERWPEAMRGGALEADGAGAAAERWVRV
jgi:hypothetical protein